MAPANLLPFALLASCSALLLAGCLAEDPTTPAGGDEGQSQPPPDPYAPARAAMMGVPCEAPVSTTATSDNLKLLGNVSFEEAGSQEIDIRGNLLLSAGSGGLGTVDVTDPLHPRVMGENRDLGGSYDVKFSPDNQTAFVGLGGGIAIVDVRDPYQPAVESTWSFSEATPLLGQASRVLLNAHMLYTTRIAEADWVFVAPNSNAGVWVLRLEGEPGNRSLAYVTQTLPVEGGPLGPHDMWVTYDEAEGAWLLYSSDGYHGWAVFNVDDPASPQLVGGLVRPETGYTHTIQAGFVDGRRIVATIQEVGVNVLEVYDATNLQAPVLLATWQVGPASTAPQHNFQIVNGTLYLAHYGNGIFLFDLRDAGTLPAAGAAAFAPVAHYATGEEGGAGAGIALGFGNFWDVVVKDGLVYGSSFSDPTLGIHVIGYGCNVPGDVSLNSPG